ncbi:hypothetical protein [Microbulbifer sp. JSM ZJ756]|uniref:hypothetical protein n=1 Tax=Microbulbifer sp. JSM ZJ756 TaxID=3376191 RepID=UPI0037A2B9C2
MTSRDSDYTDSVVRGYFPEGKHPGGPGGPGDMEARVARLESDVEYIKRDISEIKTDLREIRGDIGKVKDSISSAKIWAVMLYVGMFVTLAGIMIRGFSSLH